MVVGGGGWLVVGWCLLGVMAGVVAGGGGWLACGWLVVAGGGGWLVTAGGSSGGWWGLDRIPSDKLPSLPPRRSATAVQRINVDCVV